MQKNTTMYKEFGKDFNFKELRCVPYENAPRIVQTYCLHALQCVEENDVFVLYITTDNTPITLGFYTLDDLSIVESKYFDNLLCYTNPTDKTKDYEKFKKYKCTHISQWVFDERLRDLEILNTIFEYIMTFVDTLKNSNMLWVDGICETVFYPIEKNDKISRYAKIKQYFATKFVDL